MLFLISKLQACLFHSYLILSKNMYFLSLAFIPNVEIVYWFSLKVHSAHVQVKREKEKVNVKEREIMLWMMCFV